MKQKVDNKCYAADSRSGSFPHGIAGLGIPKVWNLVLIAEFLRPRMRQRRIFWRLRCARPICPRFSCGRRRRDLLLSYAGVLSIILLPPLVLLTFPTGKTSTCSGLRVFCNWPGIWPCWSNQLLLPPFCWPLPPFCWDCPFCWAFCSGVRKKGIGCVVCAILALLPC